MDYSQLSRKRPPLVHNKVVAYGKDKKINITLSAKIMQIETNVFDFFHAAECTVLVNVSHVTLELSSQG